MISKGIQVTEQTRIGIKRHQWGNNSKQEPSILYATRRHDLFYVTVKYHQNIPNGIQLIERTRKCLRIDMDGLTDRRQAHYYIP